MQPADYTLFDLLRRNAQLHGDATAFCIGDHDVTHRAHLARVERLAAGLCAAGIARGDRVAILSKNRIEYAELIGAAARLGAIVSALNWRLSAAEVLAVLHNDAPKIALVEDEFWPMLDHALAAAEPVAQFFTLDAPREGFGRIETLYRDDAIAQLPHPNADDPLLLIHTAWTDGRPKAATLSHANLLANAIQLQSAWQLVATDVHLCALPLFHSTAVSLMLAVQIAGGASVLMTKFDAEAAVALAERHRATVFGEFAPMLDGMLVACGDAPARMASLRHVCGLDAPATIARFEAACPSATFWSAYGQTEVSGLVSLGRFRDAPGAAGFALPLCAIAIVDDDSNPVATGEVGEIAVRGPTVFKGYWQRDADNAHASRGGWHHTGDSGRIDADGRLWYAGRLEAKALIKTGGENVYPSEVEAALRAHPGIVDAAVVGLPDARWGESILAACVARDGAAPSEEELVEFVGNRIARYKRPRSVLFVDALPKKADGTVDREQVRARFSVR